MSHAPDDHHRPGLALLVALMQGASWFSQNHQRQRNPQLEELARTLARQVTLNVAPLMRTDSPDEKRIQAILDQLTGETVIEVINKILGQQQALAYDDPHGRLVIGGIGSTRAHTALVLGENILSCDTEKSIREKRTISN